MPTAPTVLTVAREEKPDWGIIIWFAILHALALYGVFFQFSWEGVIAATIFYFLTGMLGITLGYHRLMTHRSFKAPRWVERTLATLGTLALQRSPLEWVGHHRMHHAFSDTAKDPHDSNRGFWWSHIGWMCFQNPEIQDVAKLKRFARDIVQDRYLMALTNHKVQVGLQVALGAILLAAFGWSVAIWGTFVRLVLVYHATWFVNSATHQWGYYNYESKDRATNLWWVAIASFGEGWHNNHHTTPDVAPAGHKWWEFDLTWQVIKLMRALGIAWDVKTLPKVEDRLVTAMPVAVGDRYRKDD